MTLPNIEKLIDESKQIFDTEQDSDQIIYLFTQNKQRYIIINHNIMSGNYVDEKKMLENLYKGSDTHVTCLVCIWRNLCLDIPSIHLRNGLLNLNSINRNTIIITNTERTLETTLPN